MSLTYGFYNSINHDRQYDAAQVSSIFDGIINDGVFESIGTRMMVKANTGLSLNIGDGRAWFNHTWTLNDSLYPVTLEAAELVLKRLDAIVLEVNSEIDVRENSFKVIKGTPASEPTIPELTNSETVHQHLLATVLVNPGATDITQAEITNYVGTSRTPFITGILETMNVDSLIAQWQQEIQNQKIKNDTAFQLWFDEKRIQFIQLYNITEAECQELFDKVDGMIADAQAKFDADQIEFEEWFEHLQNELDANQAANLQNQIDHIVGMSNDDVDAIFA